MSFENWIDLLANLAALLGIPIAILLYVTDRKKDRQQQEYLTYSSLDDKYIDFMKLLVANSDISFFDLKAFEIDAFPIEKRNRLVALFEIFFSILERAYVMYSDQPSKIRKKQWIGWLDYIKISAAGEGFQKMWAEIGEGFDTDFYRFMNNLIMDINNQKSSK